jgi:hypothetical protein
MFLHPRGDGIERSRHDRARRAGLTLFWAHYTALEDPGKIEDIPIEVGSHGGLFRKDEPDQSMDLATGLGQIKTRGSQFPPFLLRDQWST